VVQYQGGTWCQKVENVVFRWGVWWGNHRGTLLRGGRGPWGLVVGGQAPSQKRGRTYAAGGTTGGNQGVVSGQGWFPASHPPPTCPHTAR
jgi:hypothetical protein